MAPACVLFEDAISAGLDGEASPLGAAVVEEHLAGCLRCQRFATAASVLEEELAGAAHSPESSNSFVAEVVTARAPLSGIASRFGRLARRPRRLIRSLPAPWAVPALTAGAAALPALVFVAFSQAHFGHAPMPHCSLLLTQILRR